ncbi:MarR family winged helix-turn-helix transcriptional regulator [Melittangium boletus]|uniref:Transcriptional regulator n=1 Tax=Melittangium boletus DSM 14713 TaxID=1294270 RepID=A0A250IEY1_9BACT|nr:MarR family transcriptional regulator [Melittangium boletus]ATB29701.1 transcriptional regulator [Melittangium boletus DSM 14713]
MTKPRIGDALVDAVVSTAHRLRNQANERLRECGLSLARLKVMDLLEAQPRRMREVSDALGVVPRTLTDTVDGLEAEGLVRREEDPEDRRATLLRLTEPGRERLHQAHALLDSVHRARSSRLSAAEREQLLTLLTRFSEG